MKNNVLLACILIFAACSSGQHETFAHITQRRIDASGKVIISYQFHNGNTWVTDSMEVQRNKIVPHDSVKVRFSPENSTESRLLLP